MARPHAVPYPHCLQSVLCYIDLSSWYFFKQPAPPTTKTNLITTQLYSTDFLVLPQMGLRLPSLRIWLLPELISNPQPQVSEAIKKYKRTVSKKILFHDSMELQKGKSKHYKSHTCTLPHMII